MARFRKEGLIQTFPKPCGTVRSRRNAAAFSVPQRRFDRRRQPKAPDARPAGDRLYALAHAGSLPTFFTH
jgi:hypothetical protein